jgi:hypothetical protein
MLFRPSGRDDSNEIATLGVCYMKNYAATDANQIDTLFAVVLSLVNPFHSEWLAKYSNRFLKGNAVIVKIDRRLLSVPFQRPTIMTYGRPVAR